MQSVKHVFKLLSGLITVFVLCNISACKKNTYATDAGSKLNFSQDSVLFDTVFTSIGSSTQNIRVYNRNKKKIKISSIVLEGGSSSPFIINVDGAKGTSFSDLEIAPDDSLYIFIQVNINPNNANSPLIITDAIHFVVNGNEQKIVLEAWGQDAYYHYAKAAIKFKDGSYFPYSYCDTLKSSYDPIGGEIVWKNDKPHVIYGYCVVDSAVKLKIQAGTKIYLNYKAGLWVLQGGQIQVLGKLGNEVIFQGARREKLYSNEAGQWDRIWINEGSDNNIIDYAIIKNGYIGVQAELFGDDTTLAKKRTLSITNTKIQNMSKWGIYGFYYRIYGANNVISNCQEYSLNVLMGGEYYFLHCTFANYWGPDSPRDKPAVSLNNYSTQQTVPIWAYFGNCVIDGKLDNELVIDLKSASNVTPSYTFSSCWMKTTVNTSNALYFMDVVKGDKNALINYKDVTAYNFEPASSESRLKNFISAQAKSDAALVKIDLAGKNRNLTNVSVGAYEIQ